MMFPEQAMVIAVMGNLRDALCSRLVRKLQSIVMNAQANEHQLLTIQENMAFQLDNLCAGLPCFGSSLPLYPTWTR